MPRGPRIEIPGGIFHVASRGVGQQAIYRDDVDRRRFLRLLRQVVARERWRCLAYCLMSNHYHLVIQLREAGLSAGMQSLNGDFARGFNERHRRSGHLFQGRFWSKLVTSDAHMIGLARYIALNPVRANLCAAAGDWPWSAHRALVGEAGTGIVDVAAMLSYFGETLEKGRASYAALVAVNDECDATDVAADFGPPPATCDRDEAIARARDRGYGVAEIAAHLGCHPRTVQRRLAAMARQGV